MGEEPQKGFHWQSCFACCEGSIPFEHSGKYLDEVIFFEEGPTLSIFIM